MAAADPLLPDVDFARDEVPDLHDLLEHLRGRGSVVPVRFHGEVAWLVTRYRPLRQAFRDERRFMSAAFYRRAQEPAMGRTMQSMTGEEHRVNRALVSEPFLPDRIRGQAASVVEPETERLLEGLEDREEVDLVEAFTRRLPFRVITRLLGIPVEDDEKMLGWVDRLFAYPWDPEGALAARAELETYLRPIIRRRRETPGEDLISLLTGAEVEGERLTEDEILPFCMLLFPAGSDTTYKNLGSLLHVLLTVPGVRHRVAEGPETRRRIVEEGLRWEPPVALLPRMCSEDTELGGVPLVADTPMLFGIAAANRDPEAFEHPDRFDPDRTGRSLSFGQGPHLCLGQHLARLELTTAIRLLFERFPAMRLAPGRTAEIIGGVLRGPRELRVRPYG